MIVGSGMIAKAFRAYENRDDVLIFAKGVSNSLETKKEEFDRERTLLVGTIEKHRDKTFVYFGTCSVLDSQNNYNAYIEHKINMENIIQEKCKSYFIFRLPQVVGETKNSTLINFLATQIKNGEHFYLWKNSKRNLIDVTDVYKIASYFIDNGILKNRVTNIASSESVNITSIVTKIEILLDKKANYTVEEKGTFYDIDISDIEIFLDKIGVEFDEHYIDKVLYKYLAI